MKPLCLLETAAQWKWKAFAGSGSAVMRHLCRRAALLIAAAYEHPSTTLSLPAAAVQKPLGIHGLGRGWSWPVGSGGNNKSDNIHDVCPPQGPETQPRRFPKWTSATSYRAGQSLWCDAASHLISVPLKSVVPSYHLGVEVIPGPTPKAPSSKWERTT